MTNLEVVRIIAESDQYFRRKQSTSVECIYIRCTHNKKIRMSAIFVNNIK
jgi:hypothetical protein